MSTVSERMHAVEEIPSLEARGVEVEFTLQTGQGSRRFLRALRGVDLTLAQGECVAIVGESGSGKSTLARALIRLIPISAGSILWQGEDVSHCAQSALRARRKRVQIIFQDPLASLNPRLRIGQILAEPLEIFAPQLAASERRRRASLALQSVGLDADALDRLPRQFSGGQCQRIAIARAMLPEPSVLIADEPVSSLDVAVQGQIVNLLADLQAQRHTAIVFISHQLALVRHVAQRVLVMYLGRVVEQADSVDLFSSPRHPYTRALLAAIPRVGVPPSSQSLLAGEPASPLSPPSGCAFRTRCKHAQPRCAETVPPLEQAGQGHVVACLRWREI